MIITVLLSLSDDSNIYASYSLTPNDLFFSLWVISSFKEFIQLGAVYVCYSENIVGFYSGMQLNNLKPLDLSEPGF